MDVHVRDLRYFVSVARELHFTRAAEILYVSQPALSKQIRALERQLRVTLFDRVHGSVRLTRAGSVLLPHAEGILESWDAATGSLAKASDCALVIGMHTSPGRGLLPRVRALMVESCPDAELDLRHIPWSDQSGGLADGATDAAFVWLPVGPADIESEVLATERLFVALSAGHPLAGRAEVEFAEIMSEPIAALPASAGPLRDFWLAVDQRAGRAPRVAAEVSTADEVFEIVSSGAAVTLLAEGNAAIYSRQGIVCIPVSGLEPARLAIAWRREDKRPAVRDFVRACRDAAAEPTAAR